MDQGFWHRKWERNEIAFHEREANPALVRHFDELSLPRGRVFVPLCGKTLDIHWLLSRGHRVAGAELSRIAVDQLFAELNIKPEITELGPISRFSADRIDIFVGDIFNLSRDPLGPIDAIYDRAALVALPATVRSSYTAHLMDITDRARQLLLTFEYDQRLVDGPPFSITAQEVGRHYQDAYDVRLLASAQISGGMKGKCPAAEHVWLLNRRAEQERSSRE